MWLFFLFLQYGFVFFLFGFTIKLLCYYLKNNKNLLPETNKTIMRLIMLGFTFSWVTTIVNAVVLLYKTVEQ